MNKGWHMGMRLIFGALITAVTLGGTAGLASAQNNPDPYVAPSPTVEVESASELPPTGPGDTEGAQVESATSQRGPSSDVEGSNLAFTGSDVTVITILGFAALITGGLVLFARRRTTSA